MNIGLLIELAWKSTVCAALALFLLELVRSRSAAEKSLIAYLGVLALLLLPACIVMLPKLQVQTDEPLPTLLSAGLASPRGAVTHLPPVVDRPPISLNQLIYAYPAVTLLFLAGVLVALLRLRLVRRRAELLSDPVWLAALAAAQRRMNFKHGTALLVSSDVSSPISWGLMRGAGGCLNLKLRN